MTNQTLDQLTKLTCTHCRKEVTPKLMRAAPNKSHLGAWCPNCKGWIAWLPQNTVWLALEQQQNAPPPTPSDAGSAPHTVQPFDPAVARTERVEGPSVPITGPGIVVPGRDRAWMFCLAEMGHVIYADNDAKGFHDKPRSTLERAMLVVTELAELSEAARHGTLQAPSEHIPNFTQAAEEWADVLVRVFDHSQDDGVTPLALAQAFVAKLAYNRTRPFRHGNKTI